MKRALLFLLLVSSAYAVPTINELRLVKTSDGSYQPADGGTLPQGTQCVIRAKVNSETQSVVFIFDSTDRQIKAIANATASADYMTPPAGAHTVTATPWSRTGGTGTAGASVRADYLITPATTPSPTPTGTPTATATPSTSPSASPSTTATATPTATTTATTTPPISPSPSATPTPASVTVQVINPTNGDVYEIYYGNKPGDYTHLVPIPAGQSSVRISSLSAGAYYFANVVKRAGLSSVVGDPVSFAIANKRNYAAPIAVILLFIALGALVLYLNRKNKPL